MLTRHHLVIGGLVIVAAVVAYLAYMHFTAPPVPAS